MRRGSIRLRLSLAAAIAVVVVLAIAGAGLVYLFERHVERQVETDLTVDLNQVIAATKEAVVNAAKHSGAPTVDVYAEVEPALVSVFVRDRGRGFDPEAVPEDRHGLSGSVVGRMQRHGGTARVRSTVGSGTEITLELPRG